MINYMHSFFFVFAIVGSKKALLSVVMKKEKKTIIYRKESAMYKQNK